MDGSFVSFLNHAVGANNNFFNECAGDPGAGKTIWHIPAREVRQPGYLLSAHTNGQAGVRNSPADYTGYRVRGGVENGVYAVGDLLRHYLVGQRF